MFQNKISTIPIILFVVGWGGLTLSSCAVSKQEAFKNNPPSSVQDVTRESPPPQPLLGESILNRKADLPDKGGVGQPLQPANDLAVMTITDIPKNDDESKKSAGPIGASSPILSADLSKKS